MAERPPLHAYEPERKPNGSAPVRLLKSESEFLAAYPRPDYLVSGLLRRRFIYSMTGPTGSGKTAMCLLIVMLVLLGRPLSGRRVKRGRVLYLAGENDEDVYNRWIKMRECFSIPKDEALDIVFLPGVPTRDMSQLRAEAASLGSFDLVVVDTSAAYFAGDEENSNTDFGDHAREMRKFSELEGGPTVIVTCHPVKNYDINNLLPRGGGAFLNEVDGNLACVRKDPRGNPIVELTWHGKFRGQSFDRLLFKLAPSTSDDSRLTTTDGEKVWVVVAETATEAESDAAEDERAKDRDAMLLLMDGAPGCSFSSLATKLKWTKRRVQTLMQTFEAEKLVEKSGAHYALTAKGRKAAKAVEPPAGTQEGMPF